MPVITRKPGERIQVDGPAAVKVIRVDGARVKLGIEAAR